MLRKLAFILLVLSMTAQAAHAAVNVPCSMKASVQKDDHACCAHVQSIKALSSACGCEQDHAQPQIAPASATEKISALPLYLSFSTLTSARILFGDGRAIRLSHSPPAVPGPGLAKLSTVLRI